MKALLLFIVTITLTQIAHALPLECRLDTLQANSFESSTKHFVNCQNNQYSFGMWMHNFTPIKSVRVKITEFPKNAEAKVREVVIPITKKQNGLFFITMSTFNLVMDVVIPQDNDDSSAYAKRHKKHWEYEVISYIVDHECTDKAPQDKDACLFLQPQYDIAARPSFMREQQ